MGLLAHLKIAKPESAETVAHFVCGLLNGTYRYVTKFHLVVDNLNTHFRGSFEEVLG